MGFSFQFRDQLLGPWDSARGWIVQQFAALIAQLTPLAPMIERFTVPYPANRVLVTDDTGNPSFTATLPPVDINTRAGRLRTDGSQVIPTALALNSTATAAAGMDSAQLGVACVITSTANQASSGPQALEGYCYLQQAGTTALAIGTIGNIEHGGTGTTTTMRAVQGGFTITSSGGGTKAVCFHAAPSGRAFGGSGTFTNGYGLYVDTFGSGLTNKYALFCADSTAGIFLTSDAAEKSATSTWTVTSDGRTKRNVTPFKDGLTVVLALQPVAFEYNGKGDTAEGVRSIGLIADDAERSAPYLIGTRTRSDGLDYKTRSDGALIFVLINAVQELAKRLDTLERKANG